MRAKFVEDPAKLEAVILPNTGHWLIEENPEGVEKVYPNFYLNNP